MNSANTKENWNRVGYVKIIPAVGDVWCSSFFEENLKNRSLNFSFDITKPISAVCSDAKISIFGMNWDHILAFSTWTAEAIALGLDTRIEVWAGYGKDESGAVRIFSGTIYNAMPSNPPERVLHIRARSGFFRFNIPINGDSAPSAGAPNDAPKLNVDDWFSTTAALINGVVNTSEYISPEKGMNEISQVSFGSFATHDTVFKKMCEQAKALNPEGVIIEEDATADSNSKMQYNFKLINRYETKEPSPEEAILVSQETGMVGLPTIKYHNIEVTTLLNNSIARGGYIKLKSPFTPNLNSFKKRNETGVIVESESYEIYRVYEVRYHGELRGDKWYTTFKAWRFWKEGMLDSAQTSVGGSL